MLASCHGTNRPGYTRACMCGIYGLVDFAGIRHRGKRLLNALAASLVHRGPDGGGRAEEPCAQIGMRRLAVIDLHGGMQPLWNEDRSVAAVVNGEIYNYRELRDELRQRGHRFSTDSDCEVVVHLWEEHGPEMLKRLRGMFAVAILDLRERRLLLARDRLGEKPLYLAERDGSIVFASELRALVAAGAVPFRMDPSAIHDYLAWGFVPEPASAVEGTRKLGAGCLLDIDLVAKTVKEGRWWSLLESAAIDAAPGDAILSVLKDVGRLVVRSDVPIAVALSGGVDSSLVAAMSAAYAEVPVHAFTVGYPGNDRHDETAMAMDFAADLGIPHHRVTVRTEDVVRDFPDMCIERDDPLADISGSGYRALVRAVHAEGFRVLMMGHGGDELFWGYPWTLSAVRHSIRKRELLDGRVGPMDYMRLTRPPLSYAGALDWALGWFGLGEGLAALRRDRRSAPGRMVFWDERPNWRKALGAEHVIAGDRLRKAMPSADPARIFTFDSLPERPDLEMTDLLVKTYLLSNGLDQCDRLSMAASVEARLPLVDYRLAEAAIGLRKLSEDWKAPPKKWLSDAAGHWVPRKVFQRRKRGFTPPWREWTAALCAEYGQDLVGGLLEREQIIAPLRTPLRPIDALGRPHALAMPLLMLEEWARGMRRLADAAPRD